MHIVRFLDENDKTCLGCEPENGKAEILHGSFPGEFERSGKRVEIKQLLSPVNPPAIFCIGLNYRQHANETGMEPPNQPIVFMKNPAAVTAHGSEIILPESCRDPLQVDYEVELAVVIGKSAKNVTASDALGYVAGYTIGNDVSARRWQKHGGGGQWVRGKSFDTFCPLGPFIVTTDEIENPDRLDLECRVNGQTMQKSNTSDMIFSVSRLIEYLSEDTTLLPGTVIMTGTPSGVGFARTPPVYLKPGDSVEMIIEAIGTLVNTVS